MNGKRMLNAKRPSSLCALNPLGPRVTMAGGGGAGAGAAAAGVAAGGVSVAAALFGDSSRAVGCAADAVCSGSTGGFSEIGSAIGVAGVGGGSGATWDGAGG